MEEYRRQIAELADENERLRSRVEVMVSSNTGNALDVDN